MLVDRQPRPTVYSQLALASQRAVPVRAAQVAQLPDNFQANRASLQQEFRQLVQTHEPDKVQQVDELLQMYADMEQELLQCYRHHYTGTGGFRVPTTTTTTNPNNNGNSATFSLPKAAIATYLREKLRMRSSRRPVRNSSTNNSTSNNFNNTSCAKGDDVRSPEMPFRIPATSTTHIPTQPRLC